MWKPKKELLSICIKSTCTELCADHVGQVCISVLLFIMKEVGCLSMKGSVIVVSKHLQARRAIAVYIIGMQVKKCTLNTLLK